MVAQLAVGKNARILIATLPVQTVVSKSGRYYRSYQWSFFNRV